MIAETLAGIALVKSAVDGIKSAIGTANDIGDIAGYIDNLFEGEKQVQQNRNKKAGSAGLGDQFGVDTVAREVIDARIAAEKLQEVATMVDMRFGPGTWKGIVAERAKRIQAAKEAAIAARREEIKRQEEMMENVKLGALLTGVVVITIALFVLMMSTIASGLIN
jgi:hypothetical protein|tara:strand:- start:1514 stop:2008 length:495 start_codon:yes stop_codon:yes gene_type:complete